MIKGLYSIPTLATCSGFVLPTVDNAVCITDNVTELSRIVKIFLVEPSATNNLVAAAAPTAMTAAAWSAVIAQTGAGKIRVLSGVGALPKPTSVKQEVNGESYEISKDFKLSFAHNNISIANYEMMRLVQQATFFMWFQTEGGYIYGGLTGIRCKVEESDYELTNAKDSIGAINFSLEWRRANYPNRDLSPIA